MKIIKLLLNNDGVEMTKRHGVDDRYDPDKPHFALVDDSYDPHAPIAKHQHVHVIANDGWPFCFTGKQFIVTEMKDADLESIFEIL